MDELEGVGEKNDVELVAVALVWAVDVVPKPPPVENSGFLSVDADAKRDPCGLEEGTADPKLNDVFEGEACAGVVHGEGAPPLLEGDVVDDVPNEKPCEGFEGEGEAPKLNGVLFGAAGAGVFKLEAAPVLLDEAAAIKGAKENPCGGCAEGEGAPNWKGVFEGAVGVVVFSAVGVGLGLLGGVRGGRRLSLSWAGSLRAAEGKTGAGLAGSGASSTISGGVGSTPSGRKTDTRAGSV